MRKYISLCAIAIAIIITAISLNSCSEKSQAKEARATISVPTAKCATCKKTIETALKNTPGVENASVSSQAPKTVSVVYDSTKITEAGICKAISLAGYTANNVPRDDAAYQKLDDCCK